MEWRMVQQNTLLFIILENSESKIQYICFTCTLFFKILNYVYSFYARIR